MQIGEAREQVAQVLELDKIFERFTKLVRSLNIDEKNDHLQFKAVEFRFGMFLDVQNEMHKDFDGKIETKNIDH